MAERRNGEADAASDADKAKPPKPDAAKPDKADAAKPENGESDTAKSVAGKSNTANPDTSKPDKQPGDTGAVPPTRDEHDVEAAPERSSFREAVSLLFDLRASPMRKIVIWLAVGILIVICLNMVGQIRLNRWYGDLFNAIEKKNIDDVWTQVIVFLIIAGILLALVVGQTWLHEMIKLRMREMLTHRLLDDWLLPSHAYRLGIASEVGVNPDQRMQEDVRNLSELSADLGVGMVQHILLLGSFIGVLWVLSQGVTLPLWGEKVTIPGYMVWCALLYAGIGSWLTWRIGRPLVRLNVVRYQREAELRFALVRVSESAESVALYGGETDERRIIDIAVANVIAAMRRVTFAIARLTWITSGYGWLALIVPTIVALPGYFYGALTLGGLMMVVGAFNQVQQALRWFVDNYAKIADWRAALHRVALFHDALRTVDDVEEDESRITLDDHPDGRLAFKNVSVLLADGGVIIKDATAEINPGERVLIVGESGSGKSTLFRAIAGLWPWGGGAISLPPRDQMMFMPQRPYLPLGTLMTAVTYPSGPDAFERNDIEAALKRVGLPEFAEMLEKEDRWDRLMSVGQQQRLAFARLLLHKPRWVFLDEATAALDEANQTNVMSVFDQEIAGATVVSIGHRPGLEAFHTRTLELTNTTTGARLRRKRKQVGKRRAFKQVFAFIKGSRSGKRKAEAARQRAS